MTDGPKVLQNIKNKNGLGNIVLVSLGSNGTLSDQNMVDILNISEGRKSLFCKYCKQPILGDDY
ncbi:MAG: hypothetical protein ACLTA5_06400 [Anaerococcus obesiensis]